MGRNGANGEIEFLCARVGANGTQTLRVLFCFQFLPSARCVALRALRVPSKNVSFTSKEEVRGSESWLERGARYERTRQIEKQLGVFSGSSTRLGARLLRA